MDFFDKLSQKASETYKMTKEKTSQISGELKLKTKINELKSEIYDLYTEIGKAVYEAHKQGEEIQKDEITEKLDEIAKKEDEISKAETEILTLKKIKKCINCGAELNDKDEFCSKCGTKQPEIQKEEVKVENEAAEDAKDVEVTEVVTVEEEKTSDENDNN